MKKKKDNRNITEEKKVETSEDLSLSVEEKRNATNLEASQAEQAVADKKTKRKKNLFGELFRFVVVGVICTLIDFGCQLGMLNVFQDNLSKIGGWGFYVAFAISITVAFIVSVCVNFAFSRLWVFQNVDKNVNTKSGKAFWAYFFLGMGGWVLGVAIQEAGVYICDTLWNVGISLDITKVSMAELFTQGGIVFWAFVAIFCIKTLITMVYNYLTRKLIIFKAPKKEPQLPAVIMMEEPKPAPAPVEPKVKEVEEKTIEQPKLVTAASFRAILNEELEKRFTPGQHKMNREKAWKMVNDEINKREESGISK